MWLDVGGLSPGNLLGKVMHEVRSLVIPNRLFFKAILIYLQNIFADILRDLQNIFTRAAFPTLVF